MNLEDITPLILTFDEAPNIQRCLEKLAWARDIVVIDSGSTDDTLKILASVPQVRVLHRNFDSFAAQCNHGLEQIRTEWVLSLDADYRLGEHFAEEMAALSGAAAGYRASFRYCVHGRPLRACLYPARTVLYRRSLARYENEGHGHRVRIDGPVEPLQARIDHDDRKPLSRWVLSQMRYAEQEARHLLTTPVAELNRADRIRRWVFPAPVLVFLYTWLLKGLIFDGLPGWHYVMQRTLAEVMLSLQLAHQRVVGTQAGS